MYKNMRKIYTFVIPYQDDVVYILLGRIFTVFVIPWVFWEVRNTVRNPWKKFWVRNPF